MNRVLVLFALSALLAGLVVAAPSDDASTGGSHASIPVSELELCVACHGEVEEDLAHGTVHAPLAAGDCTSCHDPHVARFEHLLRKEPDRLCMSCHTNLRDEMRRPVTHAALRDENSCAQCHDPHASGHAGLLREQAGVLCAQCHEQIGEQLAQEHPHLPATEGECSSCHEPHAGTDLALLTESTPGVCLSCHPAGASLDGAHRGFAMTESDCGSCHTPHGSPRAGLLRPLGHMPFDDDGCAACHTKPRDPSVLTMAGTALCEDCHGDYAGTGDNPGYHLTLDDDACTDCHSPHAGEAPALMNGPQHLVCLECHVDIGDEITNGNSYHPRLADSGTCSACHQTHDAQHQPLLKADEATLCQDCHGDHSKFAHPMGPNVPDPIRPGKSIDCLSCHDPHASEHKMMLTAEPDRDLCVACHGSLHSGG